MEVAAVSGNSRRLLKHIRNTDGRQSPVGEIAGDRNGEPILDMERRLTRWTEYFKEHSKWPRANVATPTTTSANPWESFLDRSTDLKIQSTIQLLKRGKPAGLVKLPLPQVLFKMVKETLVKALTLLSDI